VKRGLPRLKWVKAQKGNSRTGGRKGAFPDKGGRKRRSVRGGFVGNEEGKPGKPSPGRGAF